MATVYELLQKGTRQANFVVSGDIIFRDSAFVGAAVSVSVVQLTAHCCDFSH
jgi:hypothetical protein